MFGNFTWILIWAVLPTLVYLGIGLFILSLEQKKGPGYKLPALIYFISVPSIIVIVIALNFAMNYQTGRFESADKPAGYELYKFLVLKDIIPRSGQSIDEKEEIKVADENENTNKFQEITKSDNKTNIEKQTLKTNIKKFETYENLIQNLKVGEPAFSIYLGDFDSGEKNTIAEVYKEKWSDFKIKLKGLKNKEINTTTTKFMFYKDGGLNSFSKTVHEQYPKYISYIYNGEGFFKTKRINIPKEFNYEGGYDAFHYKDSHLSEIYWYYYDTGNLNIVSEGANYENSKHGVKLLISKINENGQREFDGLCKEPNDWYLSRYNLSCEKLYQKEVKRIKKIANSFSAEKSFVKFEENLKAKLNKDNKFFFKNDEKYYALVIGNNNYQYLEKLDAAENDAKVIADILENKYGFEVELLLNGDYSTTVNSIFNMTKKLKENDNLLIYYAGHGELDKSENRGYWLPVNASTKSRAEWISNQRIVDRVKATKAKHVLLMVDSCFSGSLMRGGELSEENETIDKKYIERLKKKKTRLVITSGGNEPVVDSDGGNHSLFALKLIDTLKNNDNVINSQILFENIRRYVVSNADQTPERAMVHKTGHDGGDFLFFPVN